MWIFVINLELRRGSCCNKNTIYGFGFEADQGMIRTLPREAEKNGKEIIKKNYDLNCNIMVKYLANYSLVHLVRWEMYLLNLRLGHNDLQAEY